MALRDARSESEKLEEQEMEFCMIVMHSKESSKFDIFPLPQKHCHCRDTKEKHFESLRFGIDNNVSSLRMFQAMMLVGTEMASKQHRKAYGIKTKFRTIPGAVGYYNIFDEQQSIAEIEEIIVGNNTFKESDYLECRVMNLLIATFYNNSMFGEVFEMLKNMKVSCFDFFIYMQSHPELYSEKINKIIDHVKICLDNYMSDPNSVKFTKFQGTYVSYENFIYLSCLENLDSIYEELEKYLHIYFNPLLVTNLITFSKNSILNLNAESNFHLDYDLRKYFKTLLTLPPTVQYDKDPVKKSTHILISDKRLGKKKEINFDEVSNLNKIRDHVLHAPNFRHQTTYWL